MLTICLVLVHADHRREQPEIKGCLTGGEEGGVSSWEALRLLRNSKHLQTIARIIGFAAIGAAIVEQQLNMAAAAAKGAGNTDSMTSSSRGRAGVHLGHRLRHPGVADEQDPAVPRDRVRADDPADGPRIDGRSLMLVNGALWAPALARVIDTSLRYTVDKTTREILFLPLPNDLKQQAKPFIDVTVDRFGPAAYAPASARADQALGADALLAADQLGEPR